MGSDEGGYKGYSVVSLPSKMRNKSSGLLEDVATYLIVFTHSCVEKMESLPFPVGTIVEAVEELVVPLAHTVEGFTLRLLAAVDDQILAVGTGIEGCILCLRTQGLIGMSADLWVQHEASVRERMQSIIDLANKVPLIGLITPFISVILVPLGNALSDWLVDYSSQSHVKKIQFHNKEIEKGKEERPEKPAGDWLEDASDIVDATDPTDTTLKKDVEGAMAGEAKKGVQELTADNLTHDDKENDAEDVSAVLELIDSGWLMGSAGAFSHKASVAPKTSAPITSAAATPKTSSNLKKPSTSKSMRSILRH